MRPLIALLPLVAACTDVDLLPVPQSPRDLIELAGEFCSSEPRPTEHPIRILFVVDSSSSMAKSDPQDQRVEAMQKVVSYLKPYSNISFGLLRFGQERCRELEEDCGGKVAWKDGALFTNDQKKLGAAFDRMRDPKNGKRYLGGSDYVLALKEADAYLKADIAQNPTTYSFYSYFAVFMTDAMPQSGTTPPADTKKLVLQLIDALRRDYAMRLDVVSIVNLVVTTEEFKDLMPSMAQRGGGAYIPLSTPAGFDEAYSKLFTARGLLLEYELANLDETESPRAFIAVNRNLRVARVGDKLDLFVDSDGDGLPDALEVKLGLSPKLADTDGDGLDDFVECQYDAKSGACSGEYDPKAALSPALGAADLSDEDGDGLSRFAELNIVRTDPALADTDGDGVVDGVELRAGSDPRMADMSADRDSDGLSNAFELRQHTSPLHAEEKALLERASYRFEPIGMPFKVESGRRCYRFHIRNIHLAATLAARDLEGVDRPAGFNMIEVWRLERPITNRADQLPIPAAFVPQLMRRVPGRKWVIFRPSLPRRDPPALELRMNDDDFDSQPL
jgi:hypothetical protein